MAEIKKRNLPTKILLSCLIIASLAVIWASLHDIIKGEEDVALEIIATVLSFGVFIFSVIMLKKIMKKI